MLALKHHFSIQNISWQEAVAPAKHRGFSLIELLVVIVIVAILLTIGLGVVSNVRGKADQSKCASNLRQILFANLVYAQEHDDYIAGGSGSNTTSMPDGMPPNQRFWWWRLLPYLGMDTVTQDSVCEVLVCPGDPGNGGEGYPYYENQSKIWKRSYGRNNFLHHDGVSGLPPKKLSEIEHPSRTAFAGDIAWYKPGLNTHYIRGVAPWINNLGDWHHGNLNLVFLDGRVESFHRDTLRLGNKNNWVWSGVLQK